MMTWVIAALNSIEPDATKSKEILSGAETVVRALLDNGVDVLFGYPGGAVLPIYDALFSEPRLRHAVFGDDDLFPAGGPFHEAR